jgi:hypothetical protein
VDLPFTGDGWRDRHQGQEQRQDQGSPEHENQS